MLLDRGVLERHGDEYRPVGAIEALDVPESLQALIAARLDGLDPEERRLLGDASVLGKTFLPRGLAALSGVSEKRDPAAARLARAQGGTRPRLRSTLARARSVRVPPGARPARRLRDSRPPRSEGEAPGRRAVPRRPGGDRPGRDRRGDRRPLSRRIPRSARRAPTPPSSVRARSTG